MPVTFPRNLKELPVKQDNKFFRKIQNWIGYLLGLIIVVLATLLGYLVREFFAPANIIMIYLLGVAISAVFSGLGPSIMVSIFSALAFDFFFVQPHLTFAVADTQYIFTLIVLLVVGITISYLTSLIRQQAQVARQHEKDTIALYTLGKELVISQDMESHIEAISKRLKDTFGLSAVILLPSNENFNALKIHPSNTDIHLDESEMSTAYRSFQARKTAGYKTDKNPNTRTRYLPLVTARGAIGVMAIQPTDILASLTPEQNQLLAAYTDLAAVAIEGIQLADELRESKVLKDTEKLQTALLNAISHDLRTPLVSIIGALSSLQEQGIDLDDVDKTNMIEVAREDAERLNHLITNLLDESRIEAGAIRLSKHPSDIQDLVGATLEQLGSRVSNHTVKINIPDDMPYVPMDFGLMVQALVNILDNAIKYSPAGSTIEIAGKKFPNEIQIEVADRGIGILPQDLVHVFDKFYRIKRPDTVTGTGLGLSISKGIVESHGGHITAENREGRGTIIKLTLPLQQSKSNSRENFDE